MSFSGDEVMRQKVMRVYTQGNYPYVTPTVNLLSLGTR
jgi:hypothetical protein